MKKGRIVCILFSPVMLLELMPGMTAYADSPISYSVWIGGTEVTSKNLSGQGWSYNPDSSTLTLKNDRRILVTSIMS